MAQPPLKMLLCAFGAFSVACKRNRNLLDFFSSSSSLPLRRREIAETLGTVLLSHIFSLINLNKASNQSKSYFDVIHKFCP